MLNTPDVQFPILAGTGLVPVLVFSKCFVSKNALLKTLPVQRAWLTWTEEPK